MQDILIQIMPLMLIFLVFYFLIIRPQSKRAKEHKALIENLRRGDQVITQGGLIGKISKVDEVEVEIEVAKGINVKVVRSMIVTVQGKTEPAKTK